MADKSGDYDIGSVSRKPLKIKGDSGKVHKKKKKNRKKKMEKVDVKAIEDSETTEEAVPTYSKLTEAQLKFKRTQEKRQMDKILKKASKSHKERVEEFNRHLDSLSEHYDIPKVSWTK